MRLTLICLAIGIILRLAFQLATEQTVETSPKFEIKVSTAPPEFFRFDAKYTKVTFTGGVAKEWLVVERHNKKDWEARGFDPSFTDITSDFKPVVRKSGDKWVIEFVSSIAEQLP